MSGKWKPTNLSSDNAVMNMWKLIILNGQHAGSEVALLDSMLLGSDEEQADLVLKDAYIPPQLVAFDVDETGIKLSIKASGTEILVEQQPFTSDENAPLQQVISIGELDIAFCAENESWDEAITQYSPIPNDSNESLQSTIPSVESKNSSPGSFANIDKARETMMDYLRLPQVKITVASVVAITCAAMTYGMAVLKKENINSASTLSVSAPSASALSANADSASANSAITAYAQAGSPAPDSGGYYPPSSSLQTLLADEEYQNITIEVIKGTQVVQVSGYVQDNSILNRLRHQLDYQFQQFHNTIKTSKQHSENDTYQFDVYSLNQITQSAKLVLSNLNLEAKEINQGSFPGSFTAVIDGDYLEDWETAKTLLVTDIPGLQEWNLEIKNTLPPLERLKKLVETKSFAKQTSYVEKDNVIQIVARLNDSQKNELTSLMEEFRSRVGETPALEYIAPNTPNRPLTLNDLGIAAVRSGINPYVTHQNGKRYLPGARLPNGTNLQELSAGEVTVQRGTDTYVIRYDQESNGNDTLEYRASIEQ
ncbi:Yop proteins translocation protein D [Thalassocella blandensis]|nr:Yop proteins translocation protein D [Thalassocella blandensis]